MTNKKLAVIAGALMALGPAVAGPTPNGITTYSGSSAFPYFYLDCVGEYVEGSVQYDARFHMFTTKSGTTHMVDNWSYGTLYTGISGRQWYGEGHSPTTWNYRLNKGEVYQWTSSSVMRPLDGGGASFVFRILFKMTVNANGELQVLMEPDPDRAYVCLGAK